MEPRQKDGRMRFFVKQAILLAITVILLVFFTIPLARDVKRALNARQLQADLNQGTSELTTLQKKLNAARSMVLMAAGDDDAQDRLQKEIEELKRQLSLKEVENKHLQNEIALVQSMLQLVGSKSSTASSPVVDTGHKLAEFLAKILGCIGSLFSGVIFVFSWWKKRREPAPVATS